MDFDGTMKHLRGLAESEVTITIGRGTLDRPVAHMNGTLGEAEDFSDQVEQEGFYAFRVGDQAGFFLRRSSFQSAWAEDDIAGREALRIEHDDTSIRIGPPLPAA
jgi:hypothetical protein